MTKEYEKAEKLLANGVAEKHYSYDKTGILILDLGGNYCGYIGPDDKTVEVTCNTQVFCHGTISDDLAKVMGTRHNWEAEIVPWHEQEIKESHEDEEDHDR